MSIRSISFKTRLFEERAVGTLKQKENGQANTVIIPAALKAQSPGVDQSN
jgi:hypothetical protein